MYDNTKWAKILVIALLAAAFILSIFTLVPIARGYGASLSYGDGANMGTLAQLTQAREGLYKTLPEIFVQGGSAVVQLALALTVIFLGGGVGLMLVAISFNLGAKGYVGVIQAKHDIEAGPMPKIRTLPSKAPQLYSSGKLGSRIGSNRRLISNSGSEGNQSQHGSDGRSRSTDCAGESNGHPIGDISYHSRSEDADISTFSEDFSPGAIPGKHRY